MFTIKIKMRGHPGTRVVIEKGTIFEVADLRDAAPQTLRALDRTVVILGSKAAVCFEIEAECLNPSRPAPEHEEMRLTPFLRDSESEDEGRPAHRHDRLGDVENRILGYLALSRRKFDQYFPLHSGVLHVIKYLPASRLADFERAGKRLYASDVPGYTWGAGLYVAPVALPLSTMMYGRVGIVGTVAPNRVYDAIDPQGIELYQAWIRFQWQWYKLLTTTVHADHANRYLRNAFRRRFRIDCVFFRPDQFSPGYVTSTDTWFAITHWRNGDVASGLTSAVRDAEWCVIGSDEFSQHSNRMVYLPLLRGAAKLAPLVDATSPSLGQQIIQAYTSRRSRTDAPVLVVDC